jgi:phosphopantetheinyl transferase
MVQSEVTIYAIRTDTVRKWDLSRLEQRMPERMRKADRFVFEKDRLLCLGAGILLHEALGISGEALIRYGKNGKPFAPGYPAFSLSHSGQWCLLATGGICQKIGVDVEEISEQNIDIASAVYTESELIWMKSDPVNRFYRLWTWKESLRKLIIRYLKQTQLFARGTISI